MSKEPDKLELMNHNIIINDRQGIQISGVIKIDSFDNEEFILETSAGILGLKGKNLEIIKLDTYEGTIAIKGTLNMLSYFADEQQKKENTMISRLFK